MLKFAALTLLATPALADEFIYFHTPSDNNAKGHGFAIAKARQKLF